jgi:hypothetical protein
MTPSLTAQRADALIAAATEEIRAASLCEAPVVSVGLVTYNQASFIAKAVDSVLAQRTSFAVEILIADDHSTDGTTEIVLDYQRRFPERVRVLLARENLGRHTGNGRLNFVRALRSCRGEYTALLEGDDFWVSESKLEKQVGFLARHPDFVLCGHAVTIVPDDPETPIGRFPRAAKAESTIDDLLAGNFIHTASALFRTAAVPELPDWFYGLPMGDWPLWCLLARCGKVGFLDEAMGAYRLHSGGVWSSRTEAARLEAMIQTYESLALSWGQRDAERLTVAQAVAHARLATARRLEGDRAGAASSLQTALGLLMRAKDPDPSLVKPVLDAIASAFNLSVAWSERRQPGSPPRSPIRRLRQAARRLRSRFARSALLGRSG